jgi:hypothetical protein
MRMQPMIKRQHHIEHSNNRSQACLDVDREAMMDALEIAHDGHHRQGSLHAHAFIPGAFGTQLAVVGNPIDTAKAIIGQDNTLPVHLLNDRMNMLIMHIHSRPVPRHHLPLLVEHCALAEWERAVQWDSYR